MIRPRSTATALFFAILALGTPLFATQLRLAWDPSPNPAIVGYRLHLGTTSGSYPHTLEAGANTSITVPDVVAGRTYFFTVTGYNSDQVESAPSNEISYSVPGSTPAPVPEPQAISIATGDRILSFSIQRPTKRRYGF